MINIALHQMHCDEETDEVGDDEPYVLATAVALTPAIAGVQAFIASDVVVYPFANVETGSNRWNEDFDPFWGIGGVTAALTNPDDVIFLVAMNENDDGDPQVARGLVDTAVHASLVTSLAVPRAGKVTSLARDIDFARRITLGLNFDDAIGAPQELRFTTNELNRAEAGEKVVKTLVFDGDGGRYTLDFVARNPNWFGPVAFGDSRLVPGGFITPVFEQSETIHAALTIDRLSPQSGAGTMNVVWVDGSGGWRGPESFGNPTLHPGGFITPVFKQWDATAGDGTTLFAALTVGSRQGRDRGGAMNVVWLDVNDGHGWHGPDPFGQPVLAPGGFITPVFKQSDTIFAALTIDRGGSMNLVWLDVSDGHGWHGPDPFGQPVLAPGGFITPVFKQSDTIFAALTIDRGGSMNLVWLDVSDGQGWHGPDPFGQPDLSPGGFITPVFKQTDDAAGDATTVFAALTIARRQGRDPGGRMKVVWLDLSDGQGWHGPDLIGDPVLHPGGFITPAFGQGDSTLITCLTVGVNGTMNVVSLDWNNVAAGWQGPDPFGGAHLSSGGFVTPQFWQTGKLFPALTVGNDAAMNVAGIDISTNSGWQGPDAFGDPRLSPGGFITPVFRQTDSIFCALTIDRQDRGGMMNVVWVNI